MITVLTIILSLVPLFIFSLLYLGRSTVMKDYQSPKKPCKASWQVKVYGGNLYEVKCRRCGVRVESGGTPICPNPRDLSEKELNEEQLRYEHGIF